MKRWTVRQTEAEARRLVLKWAPRLGLSDMDISVQVLLPKDMHENGDAALHCRDDSAQAMVSINRFWWKEDGPRIATPDLELNTIHELCHLLAREMTHFLYRHRGTSENDKAWFKDAEERFADRTAVGLLRWDRREKEKEG